MSQLYWTTPPPPRRAEFMLCVRPRGGLRLERADLEQVAARISLGRRRKRRISEVKGMKGFGDREQWRPESDER